MQTRTLSRTVRSTLAAVAAVLAIVAGLAFAPSLVGGYTPQAAAETATADADRHARPGHDRDRRVPGARTMTVEVAENGHDFVFAESPVLPDGPLAGAPAFGNAFVTRGYLYPEGTLNGSDGVNPDGSPEFPDEVIGEWLCSGYFIGEDGMGTTEGAMVYSTQTFSFGDDPETGADTIVVTGYEGAVVGEEVHGAITGGTGDYATARGEAGQTLIGVNNAEDPTMGIDKSVTFTIGR
jgi:hypothetical protein